MFEITIKASSLSELGEMLQDAAALHSATAEPLSAPKPQRRKPSPASVQPSADASGGAAASLTADEAETDDELQRELNEDVEPMPDTARAIVDAGTGQPVAAAEVNKKMTMEDVKVAAAKLAQKDTPKLAAILKTYGAAKISEVSKDKLGDFAADVLEALG